MSVVVIPKQYASGYSIEANTLEEALAYLMSRGYNPIYTPTIDFWKKLNELCMGHILLYVPELDVYVPFIIFPNIRKGKIELIQQNVGVLPIDQFIDYLLTYLATKGININLPREEIKRRLETGSRCVRWGFVWLYTPDLTEDLIKLLGIPPEIFMDLDDYLYNLSKMLEERLNQLKL